MIVQSDLIVGLVLDAGVLFLVVCIGIGIFGYKPERAQAIREGEARDPVLIEEIRRVVVAPPDRFRRGRIDRHPFFLAPHVGAFSYSLCVLSGAPLTNNVASLTDVQRMTMALCFLVAATLVFAGSAMGGKVLGIEFFPSVREHIATARLGDDVRLPYTLSAIGMFAMGTSTGIYSSTSFSVTIGSLGGWLTANISGACVIMFFVFTYRTRQYSRTRKVIVDEAAARIIERGSHDVE